MKSNYRLLQTHFWLSIAICIVLVIVYENEWLLPAAWSDNNIAEYYSAIVMELLTICLIPVALRLFKFGFVKRDLAEDACHALRQWGNVRLLMLSLPMIVNTFLYYQFMNVAFGYMGIIGLLSMLFVYPSRQRCESETGKEAGE